MRGHAALAAVTFVLASAVAGLSAVVGTDQKPADLGIEERVEVQLVLIDLLVLDRADRTVPGLSREDFELHVDGKTVPLETLDTRCSAATEDASAEQQPESHRSPAPAPGSGRIVLVFDYFHMLSANRSGDHLHGPAALRAAADALRSGRIGRDEIMVVSLGEVMRIEAPFGSDRDQVLRTLERMANDPALFSGPRGITEFRFFRRLGALLDLMEAQPGRKAIVLFSGPLLPDGFTHDADYLRLSAMAATSRTSIYPVDSGGLRSPLDPDAYPLGGPPMLRRLASETGGRMTSDTNDLALGPARAERDLGCVYTLGFRDRGPRLDRARRIAVLLPERSGLRAVYPDHYVMRSAHAAADSRLETASMAPGSFLSEAINVDLEVGHQESAKKRDAVFRIELDPKLTGGDGTGEARTLRGFVRAPSGAIVHRFERRIPRMGAGERGVQADTRFREAVRLRPGLYVLSAILSDPEGGLPLAAVREVSVP